MTFFQNERRNVLYSKSFLLVLKIIEYVYVCVLDTIYSLATKKIAVGNLRKIIVTLKEDNRNCVHSYDYLPEIFKIMQIIGNKFK
jgi:hypothetical protein